LPQEPKAKLKEEFKNLIGIDLYKAKIKSLKRQREEEEEEIK
jgi:hypothetical protein